LAIYDSSKHKKNIYVDINVIHNLPYVDYEDTGFIGRQRDKEDLVKRIYGAYPVISIIGDGGIGKTSLVLSCLYDLIERSDFPYERVIWVSLKTYSLQDGEFKEIKGSFKDFN